jgi:adenosylcobinamide-GDP ribazoletransferase
VRASPLNAVAFLTRLPAPGARPDLEQVAASQPWFAAAGLLIGALALAVDRIAMRALPPASVDVLVVVALVAITGGLHLDGLADAADGLLGGRTPEQRLEIMRDVHAGTYAIVAIVCVLALKWAGLAALPADVRVEAVLLTPCLARFAVVVAATLPYARPEGLGASFRRHAWPWGVVASGLTAAGAAAALVGAGCAIVVAFAAVVPLALGWLALRAAGGVTGDTLGATIEVTEALMLLFIAALAGRGWLEAALLG